MAARVRLGDVDGAGPCARRDVGLEVPARRARRKGNRAFRPLAPQGKSGRTAPWRRAHAEEYKAADGHEEAAAALHGLEQFGGEIISRGPGDAVPCFPIRRVDAVLAQDATRARLRLALPDEVSVIGRAIGWRGDERTLPAEDAIALAQPPG